ncbi:hypothetical protein APHCRT_1349 [Anaplasma phagocytophilum str. CRT53-1]|uniref:Uncharacterized protein n=1 Tax=Anaplasma phagocytophilum str. CRT53-1 TaxID=1359157 RepID=A0A0F3PSE7_ANAPH|nr:hypothetical protein APHCRT_1349 [Anaplasma phagocytophilum str. CRT53-1]
MFEVLFLRNYNTLAAANNATSSNCYSMDLSVVFGCCLLHLLGVVICLLWESMFSLL